MKESIDYIFPTKIFIFDFNLNEINDVIKDFLLEEENMIKINNQNLRHRS